MYTISVAYFLRVFLLLLFLCVFILFCACVFVCLYFPFFLYQLPFLFLVFLAFYLYALCPPLNTWTITALHSFLSFVDLPYMTSFCGGCFVCINLSNIFLAYCCNRLLLSSMCLLSIKFPKLPFLILYPQNFSLFSITNSSCVVWTLLRTSSLIAYFNHGILNVSR